MKPYPTDRDTVSRPYAYKEKKKETYKEKETKKETETQDRDGDGRARPRDQDRISPKPLSGSLTVEHRGDAWAVLDGNEMVAHFPTNDGAWRYVDRLSGQPISPAEKRTDYMVGKIIGRASPKATGPKSTVRSKRTVGRAPRDNEAFTWTEGLHPLRVWLADKLVDVGSIKTARQALWMAKSLGKLKAPMPKKGAEVFPALIAAQKALCDRQTRSHAPAVAVRDYKVGTLGPASEVRRIDPSTYKLGGPT